MSDPEKRVSAEVSESEISGSRDFQADPALGQDAHPATSWAGPASRGYRHARFYRRNYPLCRESFARDALSAPTRDRGGPMRPVVVEAARRFVWMVLAAQLRPIRSSSAISCSRSRASSGARI
jgi:hypothetical protein